MIALATLSGCNALSLGATPLSRPAVTSVARTAPARCAYNPDGASKARPKKQKTKQPKEKVKAPAAALAVEPEVTFFEGPPSATEMIIPGVSILTVVGIIPFAASAARQAWTRYKFTNRRIEVASGFQGKEVVQVGRHTHRRPLALALRHARPSPAAVLIAPRWLGAGDVA